MKKLILVLAMLALFISTASATDITTFKDGNLTQVLYYDYPASNTSTYYFNISNYTRVSELNLTTALIGVPSTNYTFDGSSIAPYYDGWCYQESVNTTNKSGTDGSCTLNYTGAYASEGTWSPVYKYSYTFDGDWSENSIAFALGNAGNASMYANYTKPIGALSSSKWQMYNWYLDGTLNLTIPSACWNAYADKIRFKATSLNSDGGDGSWWSCWNGTGWSVLRYTIHQNIYEEGMWWDIETPSNLELSNNTTGGGTYGDIYFTQDGAPIYMSHMRCVSDDCFYIINQGFYHPTNDTCTGLAPSTFDCNSLNDSQYNESDLYTGAGFTSYCYNLCIKHNNGTTREISRMYWNPWLATENWTNYGGYNVTNTNFTMYIDGNTSANATFTTNDSNKVSHYSTSDNFIKGINTYMETNCTSGYCTLPIIINSSATEDRGLKLFNLLLIAGIHEENQSFDASVWGGTLQTFVIDITYDNPETLNGYLVYNGVPYLATDPTIVGNSMSWSKTISVPNPASTTNYTFYWKFIGSDFNSSSQTQEVKAINMTNCTAGNIVLQVKSYNEENVSQAINGTLNAVVTIWETDPDSAINKTFNFTNMNTYSFCLTPYSDIYQANFYFEYYATNYAYRTYYIENLTIGNSTQQNASIYLLNATKATTFNVIVYDPSANPLADAYVYVQRFYFDENLYRTTEVSKTDEKGSALVRLQLEDAFYKYIITKDGEVIYTSQSMRPYCVSLPCTMIFNLPYEQALNFDYYKSIPTLQYSLDYNNTTNIVTYTWLDTGLTSRTGRLLVYKDLPNREIVICDSEDVGVGSTLLCNITNQTGTITAEAYITGSNSSLIDQKLIDKDLTYEDFGYDGLFWGMVIILTLVFVGIWNPTAAVALGLVGVGIFSILGLAALSLSSVLAIVVIGAILIWRLRS